MSDDKSIVKAVTSGATTDIMGVSDFQTKFLWLSIVKTITYHLWQCCRRWYVHLLGISTSSSQLNLCRSHKLENFWNLDLTVAAFRVTVALPFGGALWQLNDRPTGYIFGYPLGMRARTTLCEPPRRWYTMQKLGQELGWRERPKAVAREHSDNVVKKSNSADFSGMYRGPALVTSPKPVWRGRRFGNIAKP